MAMSMTKIRGFLAGVVAVIVLVLFAAFATSVMGMDVPGLSAIADALGMPRGE